MTGEIKTIFDYDPTPEEARSDTKEEYFEILSRLKNPAKTATLDLFYLFMGRKGYIRAKRYLEKAVDDRAERQAIVRDYFGDIIPSDEH